MTMQNLGLMLHDAARLMKSEFERRAKGHRLSLMQWRTLGALARSDGMSQVALAARVEASPMTMSDIIDRLEGDGLVSRETDPSDGRAKLVRITQAAQPIVEEMRGIATEVYATALAGIAPEDLDGLTRALQQIVTNLEANTAEKKENVA
ncbi:MarR family winged helix-turn-helix transcriptional regulator [Seohaeicola zhoushanensis]|nr:MarR family transcriptional regulator [Seohaeicola zhoushanensis]